MCSISHRTHRAQKAATRNAPHIDSQDSSIVPMCTKRRRSQGPGFQDIDPYQLLMAIYWSHDQVMTTYYCLAECARIAYSVKWWCGVFLSLVICIYCMWCCVVEQWFGFFQVWLTNAVSSVCYCSFASTDFSKIVRTAEPQFSILCTLQQNHIAVNLSSECTVYEIQCTIPLL